MPKPRALTPEQAKKTLANKFGRLGDNLRQIATRVGARPYRCFLIWTTYDGQERGQGNEKVISRLELLPTPKVDSLDAVTFSLFHAGTVPVGSVKLTGISIAQFTDDMLEGKLLNGTLYPKGLPEPFDFFYELVEDGRGDPSPQPQRYRLLNLPFRRATMVDWTVMLERVSAERNRQGALPHSPLGTYQPPLLTPADNADD